MDYDDSMCTTKVASASGVAHNPRVAFSAEAMEGTNTFLYSLLSPLDAGEKGLAMPSQLFISRMPLIVLYSSSLTPSQLDPIDPPISLLFVMQGTRSDDAGVLQVWGKRVGDDRFRFFTAIQPDQDISQNFAYYRFISMGAAIQSPTVPTGTTIFNGMMTSIVTKQPPDIRFVDASTLPSFREDSQSVVVSQKLYDGLVMVSPPSADIQFLQPESTVVFNDGASSYLLTLLWRSTLGTTVAPPFTAPVSGCFALTGLNVIVFDTDLVPGTLLWGCFGLSQVTFSFGLTTATALAGGNRYSMCSIVAVYSVGGIDVNQVVTVPGNLVNAVVGTQQGFNGSVTAYFDTPSPISRIFIYLGWVDPVLPNNLNPFPLQSTTVANQCAQMNFSFTNANVTTINQNAGVGLTLVENVDSSTAILVDARRNLEVIPNPELIRNIKLENTNDCITSDIDLTHMVLANKAAMDIKQVYTLPEYRSNVESGHFKEVARRKVHVALAADWSRGLKSVFKKGKEVLMGAGRAGLQAASPLITAALREALGSTAGSLIGFSSSSAQPRQMYRDPYELPRRMPPAGQHRIAYSSQEGLHLSRKENNRRKHALNGNSRKNTGDKPQDKVSFTDLLDVTHSVDVPTNVGGGFGTGRAHTDYKRRAAGGGGASAPPPLDSSPLDSSSPALTEYEDLQSPRAADTDVVLSLINPEVYSPESPLYKLLRRQISGIPATDQQLFNPRTLALEHKGTGIYNASSRFKTAAAIVISLGKQFTCSEDPTLLHHLYHVVSTEVFHDPRVSVVRYWGSEKPLRCGYVPRSYMCPSHVWDNVRTLKEFQQHLNRVPISKPVRPPRPQKPRRSPNGLFQTIYAGPFEDLMASPITHGHVVIPTPSPQALEAQNSVDAIIDTQAETGEVDVTLVPSTSTPCADPRCDSKKIAYASEIETKKYSFTAPSEVFTRKVRGPAREISNFADDHPGFRDCFDISKYNHMIDATGRGTAESVQINVEALERMPFRAGITVVVVEGQPVPVAVAVSKLPFRNRREFFANGRMAAGGAYNELVDYSTTDDVVFIDSIVSPETRTNIAQLIRRLGFSGYVTVLSGEFGEMRGSSFSPAIACACVGAPIVFASTGVFDASITDELVPITIFHAAEMNIKVNLQKDKAIASLMYSDTVSKVLPLVFGGSIPIDGIVSLDSTALAVIGVQPLLREGVVGRASTPAEFYYLAKSLLQLSSPSMAFGIPQSRTEEKVKSRERKQPPSGFKAPGIFEMMKFIDESDATPTVKAQFKQAAAYIENSPLKEAKWYNIVEQLTHEKGKKSKVKARKMELKAIAQTVPELPLETPDDIKDVMHLFTEAGIQQQAVSDWKKAWDKRRTDQTELEDLWREIRKSYEQRVGRGAKGTPTGPQTVASFPWNVEINVPGGWGMHTPAEMLTVVLENQKFLPPSHADTLKNAQKYPKDKPLAPRQKNALMQLYSAVAKYTLGRRPKTKGTQLATPGVATTAARPRPTQPPAEEEMPSLENAEQPLEEFI